MRSALLHETHRAADRVIEELREMASKRSVSGLALRGRKESCLNNLITRRPLNAGKAMEICDQLKAMAACPFYENTIRRGDAISSLQRRFDKRPVTAFEINEACKKERLCP